jgi:3-dehydroquinate synthase
LLKKHVAPPKKIIFVTMQTINTSKHAAVQIGQASNEVLSNLLKEKYSNAKKVIITDDNVFEFWIEQLVTSVQELSNAEIIQLPAGEDSKCIEIVMQILESLSESKIERNDLIINFGGGMISDLGGFAASIFKRGISAINIPTTLLAQVDASVGGKTGIDFGPYKNQIGTFSEPELVLVNPNYLSTLTNDELKSGYAEMLKHGLIASKKHWNNLKSIDYHKVDQLTSLITESIRIKNEFVSADPHEKSVRKALNFGHTVGHAIEGYFLALGQPIKHGYGVAWGMLAEAYLSLKKGLLHKSDWDEIHYIITDIYEPLKINKVDFNKIVDLMGQDKKNRGGKINFTLLSGIGQHLINQTIVEEEILEALKEQLS